MCPPRSFPSWCRFLHCRSCRNSAHPRSRHLPPRTCGTGSHRCLAHRPAVAEMSSGRRHHCCTRSRSHSRRRRHSRRSHHSSPRTRCLGPRRYRARRSVAGLWSRALRRRVRCRRARCSGSPRSPTSRHTHRLAGHTRGPRTRMWWARSLLPRASTQESTPRAPPFARTIRPTCSAELRPGSCLETTHP